MKMWVEYIREQGDNEYLWITGYHFGDWLGPDAKPDSYIGATTKDFIATAFYTYSTVLLARTVEIINKPNDVKEYRELYNNIIRNFRQELVSPNGRLFAQTQTAHVLELMFRLVEEGDKKGTADTLVKCLEKSSYHLTTGFVSSPYRCHVLSKNGYNDITYQLLLQTDYPSWVYQITKGTTIIWEHWDGIKRMVLSGVRI